jgi:hypothetical protein
MSKKKPVVHITEKPSTYTVQWRDRGGSDHELTFTDQAKFHAKYADLYLKYINQDIRELQIRSDV